MTTRPLDRLRPWLALAVALSAPAVDAKEAPRAQCAVPDDTALVDGPLPRLARRLRSAEAPTIVVVGSGSSAGSGTTSREASYPFRLEARLQGAYPQAKPRIVVLAETGQTAPAIRARFAREVVPLRPSLVVWQTGSADLAHGVSVAEFGSSLERGIIELHEHGIDVVLMDGQFSPRAALLLNTDGYRDAVRWTARRFDVPLLKRYDTMRYWWSDERFDLDADDKPTQLDNADRIHDCVAVLLFRLVQRGVEAAGRS